MTLRCFDAVISSSALRVLCVRAAITDRSGLRSSRWYAIVVGPVLALWLHDAIAYGDPLEEPWRIARADPLARLRSVDLARRRGGAYAIARARLAGTAALSEVDRRAEDEALLALLAQEPDASARLTALTALALPLGRDTRSVALRIEALRLPELAPPAVALAALHAFGTPEALLDAARARGSVVSADDLSSVALDALATRQFASLEGRAVEEPLRWRILARRRDPSAASAIVAELVRASGEIRGGRGLSAIDAARALRLTEASSALLALARTGPERHLRRQAVEALGALGGASDDELAALVDDPVTRGPALGAIVRLGVRGARSAVLRCLLLDDPGDRLAAVEVLLAWGDRAGRDLAHDHLAREPDAAVRARIEALLRAVAPAGSAATTAEESSSTLQRQLLTEVDEGRRLAAAMTLARREGSGALPALAAAAAVAWSDRLVEGLSLATAVARAAVEP